MEMRERTDGASTDRMPPQIGGYEVLGVLGAGAMGRVYLARTASTRLVAVKVIRPDLSADPRYRLRFAREIEAARSVGGAFTAAVVDADPEAQTPWLATEYIPAPTLSALVEACGPLPRAAVHWLAAGCAEALERIHRAGLVHRDVKPGNILVTVRGPVVIDFGLAFTPRSAHLTTADASPGTPAFMAPEQLAHSGGEPTAATDVYALGAALLFAATGHPPYPGPGVESTVFQLLSSEPDLDGVPEELVPLLTRCLQRTPELRPSCAEILRETAPYLAEQFGPPPLPEPARAVLEEYERAPVGTRSTPVDATLDLVELAPAPEPPVERAARPASRARHRAPTVPAEPADLEPPSPVDLQASTHVSAGTGSHAARAEGPGGGSSDDGGSYEDGPAEDGVHDAGSSGAGSPAGGPYAESTRALTRRRLVIAGTVLAVLGIGGGILYGLHSGQGTDRAAGAASNVSSVPTGTPFATPSYQGGLGPGGPGFAGPPATPGEPPRISVTPAEGGPGAAYVLDGANWPPEVPVTLVLSTGAAARVQPVTTRDGSLVVPLTASGVDLLPDPLKPGRYRITAISGPFEVTADFTVVAQ
jgi:serine/threonine protein kinase